MRSFWKYLTATVFTAALLLYPFKGGRRFAVDGGSPESFGDTIRCAIFFSDDPGGPRGLNAGLNYHLLKQFASDLGITAVVSKARGADCLDSLRNGALDIVALYVDSTALESGIVPGIQLEDSTVWAISDVSLDRLRTMDGWLSATLESKNYTRIRNAFLKRKYTGGAISPYDALIKMHAKRIGWDWRLLAALISVESRFSISAESSQGAIGLMQVIPEGRCSADSLLDPACNLQVGCDYITRLQKRYAAVTDSAEHVKFVLAAFNAGQGRIDDCIGFADGKGVDAAHWDTVAELIPSMEQYNLSQTIHYVDNVISRYIGYLGEEGIN